MGDVVSMGESRPVLRRGDVIVSRTGTAHIFRGTMRGDYAETFCQLSIDTALSPPSRSRKCPFCHQEIKEIEDREKRNTSR